MGQQGQKTLFPSKGARAWVFTLGTRTGLVAGTFIPLCRVQQRGFAAKPVRGIDFRGVEPNWDALRKASEMGEAALKCGQVNVAKLVLYHIWF